MQGWHWHPVCSPSLMQPWVWYNPEPNCGLYSLNNHLNPALTIFRKLNGLSPIITIQLHFPVESNLGGAIHRIMKSWQNSSQMRCCCVYSRVMPWHTGNLRKHHEKHQETFCSKAFCSDPFCRELFCSENQTGPLDLVANLQKRGLKINNENASAFMYLPHSQCTVLLPKGPFVCVGPQHVHEACANPRPKVCKLSIYISENSVCLLVIPSQPLLPRPLVL